MRFTTLSVPGLATLGAHSTPATGQQDRSLLQKTRGRGIGPHGASRTRCERIIGNNLPASNGRLRRAGLAEVRID
jgi:hypothetical protein